MASGTQIERRPSRKRAGERADNCKVAFSLSQLIRATFEQRRSARAIGASDAAANGIATGFRCSIGFTHTPRPAHDSCCVVHLNGADCDCHHHHTTTAAKHTTGCQLAAFLSVGAAHTHTHTHTVCWRGRLRTNRPAGGVPPPPSRMASARASVRYSAQAGRRTQVECLLVRADCSLRPPMSRFRAVDRASARLHFRLVGRAQQVPLQQV